jgi:predicted SnoaL-like aldol condensation-catalyzing enzyme
VEDKLKTTGMSYTILRPNGFLQNIVAYNAPSIRTQGAFYAAMGDAKVSYLDVGDIAVVAVKALQGGAHAGKTYELNGPEAISNQELAKRISKTTGRTVNYVDIPESAQREAMLGIGMPEWQVTALLELQQYYKQGGGAKTDGLLKSLIEREPVTLDQYLAANVKNSKTGMTHAEMKEFIRNHFEEFVNRKNLGIGEVNFSPGFMDHGADVPPGLPPGPRGAIEYVGAALKKVPDLRVVIEDMIAEDDKVVVRNHWTGTDASSKQRLEFTGIVIWRIANRQIVERWAYLESPHPVRG